mmetsp:Transcript_18881/g.44523  ORF Transcript_18881/g.44523 Transcript_18881/m.44523 type:complete len:215 (+) Transcript_18881:3-647(+)
MIFSPSASSSSIGSAALAVASASLPAILIPLFGTNSTVCTAAAAFLNQARSTEPFSPYVAARRFAAETMKSKCVTSFTSNLCTSGGRLVPDQKGVPTVVCMSSGKLNSNCAMVLWKYSSKRIRAHFTQSSSERGRSAVRFECSCCSVGLRTPGCISSLSKKSACERYALASSAPCTYNPSNTSRAHWMVCSIWLGKFLSVHTGIERSGGSREEA